MAKDQLLQFFSDKTKKAKPDHIDWTAKRDAWVNAVQEFFRTIEEDFLKAAKEVVEVTRTDKNVSEEPIGAYRIPELRLRVADEEVVFSPKGANVVGAKGRIDVRGDRGEATILWQEGDRWSIVISRIPQLRLVPVDADSLAEMLKGIMRP
jgi:hypothetical protein